VIGLADLAQTQATTWEQADSEFVYPVSPADQDYNIAADCLRGPRDRLALVDYGIDADAPPLRLTAGELSDAASRFAGLLGERGIGPGDRVAVKLPQSAAMAIAILGTLRAGAILVTVSDVLGEEAIAHRLCDSGAALLVCAGASTEARLAARAGATVLPARAEDWLAGPVPAGPWPATTRDDPALLLYTSGTSGKSKGVLHAHRVLLGHHAIDLAWDHVRPGDVAYSPVDWSWGGGLFLGLLAPLAYAMTVIAYRERRFDPARTVRIMAENGVSVGLFPPTALRALQRSGELTGDTVAGMRLRALVTGAEAVEPELSTWARDVLGLSINNAFGQTEANALIGHAHVLGDLDPTALGRAYPGHRIAILDSEQRPVPPGTLGEIAVRADDPVCMLGYWNAPEATAAKFRNGWLLTGDSGELDAAGVFTFHGRADDLIKSGGYRIGPAEIEAALFTHPGVEQCAAVGMPDPVRGQEVVAFVVLASGIEPGRELTLDLQARVRAQVGAHAYPRRIEYVAGLAMTSTGKVDRKALRGRPVLVEENGGAA
jgi:acetyl-CoA synthetase